MRLFESATAEPKHRRAQHSIVNGFITNNCDLIHQGKVLVRIPSMDQEVWARMTSPGAGSNAGFLYTPRLNDEVLVALNLSDLTDAYVLGGIWGTSDPPPADPIQISTKRKIRTGLTPALGHELEFDDLQQSVTITTSTQQTITMDPTKIEIATTGGSVKISLDLTEQSVTIQAVNAISLKALKSISLQAANISIEGGVTASIKSAGKVDITGLTVNINS